MTPEELVEEFWGHTCEGAKLCTFQDLLGLMAKEREACALAICEDCREGNQAVNIEGVLVHRFFIGGKESRGGCKAQAIRARGKS